MYLDSYGFMTSFSALTVCTQCYYRNYRKKIDAGQLRLVELNLLIPEEANAKARQNFQTSICKINMEKKKQKSGNNAQEISFEWQHHRISYTDSKVRTTN